MREYNKEYLKFIGEIKKRDKYKCQFPGCGSNKKLQVHHIERFADKPELLYNKNNVITLCKKCHQKIYNKEKDYIALFKEILCGATAKLWKIRRNLP